MVNIIDASGNEKPGGGPQTAKAMSTNPTNTGLSATNVDDSLKELNSKIPYIVKTYSPTVDQLKTADMVLAIVNYNGTGSFASILDPIGDGNAKVSNNDLSGSYKTASIFWNKTSGTLTTSSDSTITYVVLFFFN